MVIILLLLGGIPSSWHDNGAMGHHKHWIISTSVLGYYIGLAISTAKVCGFMVQSHSYRSMGIITAVTVLSTAADAEVQPHAGLTALA